MVLDVRKLVILHSLIPTWMNSVLFPARRWTSIERRPETGLVGDQQLFSHSNWLRMWWAASAASTAMKIQLNKQKIVSISRKMETNLNTMKKTVSCEAHELLRRFKSFTRREQAVSCKQIRQFPMASLRDCTLRNLATWCSKPKGRKLQAKEAFDQAS